MSKHTWKIKPFEREDGRGLAIVNGRDVVAWLYTASPNAFGKLTPSSIPTEAYAALIAAAPEMLEALKSVTKYLPGLDHGDPVFERISKVIVKAEDRLGEKCCDDDEGDCGRFSL